MSNDLSRGKFSTKKGHQQKDKEIFRTDTKAIYDDIYEQSLQAGYFKDVLREDAVIQIQFTVGIFKRHLRKPDNEKYI